MANGLFRREVLEARQESWLGAVRLPPARLGWPMALLAAAAALALVLFFTFGTHTPRHRVQGHVMPVGGLHMVVAGVSGVVVRTLVGEGDPVAEGQPLVEVSADIQLPGERSVGEQVAAALALQRTQLGRDLEDLDISRGHRERSLLAQVATLEAQRAAMSRALAARERQADTTRDTLERIQPLQREAIVSQVQAQQYESQALEAEAQRESARQGVLELDRQLAQLRQELADLPLETRERRSGIERAMAGLDAAMAGAQAGRTIQMRAPTAGVVSGMAAREGQAVSTGQRLLSIVPEGAGMQAELWVPSRAVGSLRPGDRVSIRYQAFPQQAFGRQAGRIVTIGGSALAPDEITAAGGVAPDEPVYRVVVALDRQHLEAEGGRFALRPHMLLDADLLLGRRRLYHLLLDPFRDSGSGASQDAQSGAAP